MSSTHEHDNFDDLPAASDDKAEAEKAAMEPMDQKLRREEPSRVRRCLRILGPGIISGASNNDPSAIATYAAAGAATGLLTLWAVPLLLPMMICIVYLSAKLGMTSGRGLIGVIREHYPRWCLYPAIGGLVVANTFNAGADLGAIGEGIRLLAPVPRWLGVIVFGLGLLALQIWAPYRVIVQLFKWLTLALFAFIVAGLIAKPQWRDVVRSTLVPTIRFNSSFIATLVAFVGTALSPYLYLWQSTQRVEEEVCMGRRRLWQRRGATEGELQYASWDVATGMTVAAAIIYFIILSTAATLHRAGQFQVESAAQAASALQPLAGCAASVIFAIGFIGAGLLAVPVLTTGAAYAVAEGMAWKFGLDRRPNQARGFYGVMAASMCVAIALNFSPIPPMRALVIAAVINGLCAGPLLILVMLATNRRSIVGEQHNTLLVNGVGWLTTAAVIAAGATLILTGLRAWK